MPSATGPAAPVMKVALPSCVSSRAIDAIFGIANERLAKKEWFRLLLDMSAVHQIEQEGLNRLYDMTQLMKSGGFPKIVIRKPNRVIRDALVLSNTLNLFDIWDDA
jgi:anti-anti-sigma regulatory factor